MPEPQFDLTISGRNSIMKTSLIFVLIVSTIAAGAGKSVEKRGTFSSSYRSQYLPPAPSATFTGGVPSPTYGVPAFAPVPSLTVPSPAYDVPAPVSSPIQSAPAISASPAFAVPALPSPAYGVPVPSVGPSYALPAPASSVSFLPQPALVGSAFGSGVASSVSLSNIPSGSYGVPSSIAAPLPPSAISAPLPPRPIVGSLPPSRVELSLPSLGHAGASGAFLGQFSLPSKSYGVPSTFGVGSGISSTLVAGQGDGYSYPVPSTKLLI